MDQANYFYVTALSSKVLIYKGQLTPAQVTEYFRADLDDPDYSSHLALVHSRFSTNTFPNWNRAAVPLHGAQRGDQHAARECELDACREGMFKSELFPGERIEQIKPVIEPDGSDSSDFDNCLEVLLQSGRTHATGSDDDDSGSVAKSRVNGSAAAGVLRVSLLHDGALGWARLGGVYEWRHDRGGPGSEWLAAIALLRDAR